MNKTIVISGASKGIGRAIAQIFAENNFNIIACARTLADLEILKTALESSHPGCKVEVLAADLSKKEDAYAFVNFVKNTGWAVDVLVNNTGYFIPGQIHTEDDTTLPAQIETNLYSAYYLTKGLVGGMVERKAGHIFTICSVASIVAYEHGGSYCISKFALLGFNKVLREELKPHNIRVTSILPGATRTASWDGVAENLPEDRLMKPEDVAKTLWAAYGLSDSAVVEELLIRPQLGDL
jgi:short-subunit dehydrogenase